MIKTNSILFVCITLVFIIAVNSSNAQETKPPDPVSNGDKGLSCPIVDTNQSRCYSNAREMSCPELGKPFYGQDAQ